MPEIALAKINPDMPMDHAAPFACGLSTGLGAAMNTAKVAARARPASSSARASSGSVRLPGARLCGAERIICVDLSEDRLELARGQGATDTWVADDDTVAARASRRPAATAPTTRSRRPASSRVMAQAVEAARMGWGLCTVAGVAGKGETLDVIPRWLIQGRRIAGSLVRRRQGPRPGP